MTNMQREAPILITGASGYIGERLLSDLSRDHCVVGLDVRAPREMPEGAVWIECDLTSDQSVRESLAKFRAERGGRIASVIHLAAYYDFSGQPSDMYDKLTVEGTRRLLRELKDFEVEQFVFSSTLLVMKPVEEDRVITEASPTRAEWDYPESKLRAESVLRKEREAVPIVILRIAGVYDEDCHSIPLAQHIARIHEKKLESYFFPGDKDHGQPFLHIDDLIDCFRHVIERRAELEAEEVFLIAEPDVISFDELQDLLGRYIHGTDWTTIRVPKAVAKAGAWAREQLAGADDTFIKPWMVDLADDHYPVAIGRARQRLGWAPKRRLRDALEEMVARMRKDPRRWYKANKLEPPEETQEGLRRAG